MVQNEPCQNFSNRYRNVPWLLTVRDAKALSSPVDAQILKIDIFDDKQIEDFAVAYKGTGSLVNIDELFAQLRAYPDLQLLARVPLFLALLLATAQPSEPLPRKRDDLLERYLHILFNPHEYKSSVRLSSDSMELREVAECLSFFALELGKTSISEREANQILRSRCNDKYSLQYILDLSVCGLLRRSVNWVSFAYPVAQEYLAACYLVSHFPDEIIQRFELSARRPWAQMLQFALEQHHAVDQIVNELLKQPDDAFGITLRLIGQCILNGADVAPSTRNQVGDQLAELWLSLPYGIGENVGKLLADGFVSPLPKRARKLLENGQGLQSGGGKLVVALVS